RATRGPAAPLLTRPRPPASADSINTAAPRWAAAIPARDPREHSGAAPHIALQRKLAIGAVDDPFEREADHVAHQVIPIGDPVAAPAEPSPPLLRRKGACEGPGHPCAACSADQDGVVQRKAPGAVPPSEAPPIVHEVLASPGRPLDGPTRAFMEPRLQRHL